MKWVLLNAQCQNDRPSSLVLYRTARIMMPAVEPAEKQHQRSSLFIFQLSSAAKDHVWWVFLCVDLPFPFGELLHREQRLQPFLMGGGVRKGAEADQHSR